MNMVQCLEEQIEWESPRNDDLWAGGSSVLLSPLWQAHLLVSPASFKVSQKVGVGHIPAVLALGRLKKQSKDPGQNNSEARKNAHKHCLRALCCDTELELEPHVGTQVHCF